MELLRWMSEIFWSPSFWLDEDRTWDDMKSTPHVTMPEFSDLYYYGIRYTLMLAILRYVILQPFVFRPLGRAIDISDAPRKKPQPVNYLELIYQSYRKISTKIPHPIMVMMGEELGWSLKKINRWFRARKISEKPTEMFKFCDSCWLLTYHLSITVLGMCVLHDKSWLFDLKNCFIGYPYHSLDDSMWWYYLLSFSFYIFSTVTFLFQHQRKDFLQMFLHHIVTLMLITFSWTINFVRIGSLILLVHECGDIPLQLGKLCNFAKWEILKHCFFVIFITCWMLTRNIIYPLWIIHSIIFNDNHTNSYPFYMLLACLLFLQAFHIIWTYVIGQIIVRMFKDQPIRDIRSDSESSELSAFDDQNNCMKKDI